MIVLVEGPDGTGKTTLCKELERKGFKYIHLSRDGKYKDTNSFYVNFIKELKKLKDEYDIVIDRGYISNYVYSKVFKDSDYISQENLEEMKSLVNTVIYCIIEDKEAYLSEFNSLKEERQELYDIMDKVYDEFHKIPYECRSRNQKVLNYDISKIKEHEITKWVDRNIMTNYTFGAELELADWDRSIQIPKELGVVDQNDITIMNSNGQAADPRNPTVGGEINTVVCNSEDELINKIMGIYLTLNKYTINHSCWLHIHVGLGKDFSLTELKEMLIKCHRACKWIPLTQLSPAKEMKIDGQVILDDESIEYLILRNQTRTYKLPEEVYEKALAASTLEEFWDCFKGKRALVNMQSLQMHGTLEFRFFYMTNKRDALEKDIHFCKQFADYLLFDTPIVLEENYGTPYKIDMPKEKIYRQTRPQYNGERVNNFTGEILPDLR